MKIATVGRGKVGKSTLINNVLNLEGNEVAEARKSARPVTKGVSKYTSTIHDVPVHIYDTHGLLDSDIDEKEVIKELRKQTEGSISLLFYVSSLNNRPTPADEKIIEALTSELTPQVWKQAICYLLLIIAAVIQTTLNICLLYTSPSPRDATLSRMPSSA